MVCRILVADDSATIQKVIRIGLAALQTEIKSAGSLMEAGKIADQGGLDLVIADAGLPGVSTATDFIKLTERAGNVPLIVLMGSYEAVRESDLRSVGITHIIKKPFPPGDLPELVKELTGSAATSSGSGKTSQTVTSPSTPGKGSPLGGIPAGGEVPPIFSLGDEISPAEAHEPVRPAPPPAGIPMFSLGDSDALGLSPPVPEVEPSRKGRPAFESRPAEKSAPARSSIVPPPVEIPSRESPLESFTGAFSSGSGFAAPSNAPVSNAGLSAAVEALVRDELPGLVDRAVERYCVEHFKGVAKEVLTAELRRLAEEKARYLVDQ